MRCPRWRTSSKSPRTSAWRRLSTSRRRISRNTVTPALFPGLENLFCAAEGHHRGRYPAVDRRLEQHLLDLVLAEPVVQRPAQVQLELVLLAERGQHAEVQHRAHLARETGPVPDVVPALRVEQIGELAIELIHPGHRLLYPLAAEHLGSRLEP